MKDLFLKKSGNALKTPDLLPFAEVNEKGLTVLAVRVVEAA